MLRSPTKKSLWNGKNWIQVALKSHDPYHISGNIQWSWSMLCVNCMCALLSKKHTGTFYLYPLFNKDISRKKPGKSSWILKLQTPQGLPRCYSYVFIYSLKISHKTNMIRLYNFPWTDNHHSLPVSKFWRILVENKEIRKKKYIYSWVISAKLWRVDSKVCLQAKNFQVAHIQLPLRDSPLFLQLHIMKHQTK